MREGQNQGAKTNFLSLLFFFLLRTDLFQSMLIMRENVFVVPSFMLEFHFSSFYFFYFHGCQKNHFYIFQKFINLLSIASIISYYPASIFVPRDCFLLFLTKVMMLERQFIRFYQAFHCVLQQNGSQYCILLDTEESLHYINNLFLYKYFNFIIVIVYSHAIVKYNIQYEKPFQFP